MKPMWPVLFSTSTVRFLSFSSSVDQVLRRHLVEVDLAGLQRRERGLLVGDVLEDDAVELHHLAAGHARGGSARGT